MLDTDDSGDIEVFELIKMFYKNGVPIESCKYMIKQVDQDDDGKISYEEFADTMRTLK